MSAKPSENARRNGSSPDTWVFLAALLAIARLLPACGRTELNVHEIPAPEGPSIECPGWPGEFFLTYTRQTPYDGQVTTMSVYPSNGDGTFGSPMKIDMKEPFTGTLIDDFDRDGALEIHVWTLSTGGEFLIDYSCLEKTWFMKPINSGVEAPRHPFSSIGDVNNDGYLDVVGWIPPENGDGQPNEDAFDVYTSFGGPGGTFFHQKSDVNLKDTFVYWLATTRHLRDMDSDGCADLIYLRYDHGGTAKSKVYLSKGDCTGHFAPPQSILSTSFPGTGNDIGDVNGDGFIDLITGLDDDGDPGQAWIAQGNGAGSLENPIPIFDVAKEEEGHDGAGFGNVFLYDWDHDGQLDALSTYSTGPKFTAPQIDLRMNLGNFEFGDPVVVKPAPLPTEQWLLGPESK